VARQRSGTRLEPSAFRLGSMTVQSSFLIRCSLNASGDLTSGKEEFCILAQPCTRRALAPGQWWEQCGGGCSLGFSLVHANRSSGDQRIRGIQNHQVRAVQPGNHLHSAAKIPADPNRDQDRLPISKHPHAQSFGAEKKCVGRDRHCANDLRQLRCTET